MNALAHNTVSEPKSPSNPSRKATARVKNPVPVPTTCPHCGGVVGVSGHEAIYGGATFGDWPWVYHCQDGCGAYVGMHPFTAIPLGTLATAAIRKARKECKPLFEALHTTGRLDRTTAYTQLAAKLGIPVAECHFGWFDEATCHRAATASRELFLALGAQPRRR